MKILPANGANIPALGLGTWQLKGEACSQIVVDALADGYRHIDTAVMYGNELEVGAGIRAAETDRDELFITTKIWPPEVTPVDFMTSVAGSLERLGVDHVDLLLIHWPPKTGDCREWAELLTEAVKRGWTKNIGVSNFTIPLLNGMVDALNIPLACNQVEHHPFLDQSRMRAVCEGHGMAMIGYCPLYRGATLIDEPVLQKLAEKYDKSAVQIVLRWHLQQESVGAIPKTATPSRLTENIDVFDFELTQGEMDSIHALGARNERIVGAFEFAPVWDQP